MKKNFEIDIENWQSLEIENKNIMFCVNAIVEKQRKLECHQLDIERQKVVDVYKEKQQEKC